MMWTFVKVAKWLFDDFSYTWLVEGFEKNIKIELDFRTEAANMRRSQHFLKENNFRNIYIPQLYLTPSKRVLVM
jgi:predicted unusual protein kinase regulating ubiquinone biosynthesis (AarF/ABC1/UbiB family)